MKNTFSGSPNLVNIKGLVPESTYTFKSLAVYPPQVQSLPNWSSMIMGAGPFLTKYYVNIRDDIPPKQITKYCMKCFHLFLPY